MTDAAMLHKFVIGELRTDGWKSDWRKELEAYLSTPKPQPLPKMVIARPKRVPLESPKMIREKYKALGMCVDCHREPVRDGRTSCTSCLKKRTERQLKRYYAKKAVKIAACPAYKNGAHMFTRRVNGVICCHFCPAEAGKEIPLMKSVFPKEEEINDGA